MTKEAVLKEAVEIISEKQIQRRVKEIAREIAVDYEGKDPILVCILNGAYVFLSDLHRALFDEGMDLRIGFMQISSYGNETSSSGKPEKKLDLDIEIENEDVIIVEDIVDSGHTIALLYKELQKKRPRSIRTCTAISKTERREIEVPAKYVGFEIEKGWVEGYGLDSYGYKRGRRNIVEII